VTVYFVSGVELEGHRGGPSYPPKKLGGDRGAIIPQYLENVITNWRIKREWAREQGKMRGQMRHQWPWLTCKQQYKSISMVNDVW